jgi:hypothetical protein
MNSFLKKRLGRENPEDGESGLAPAQKNSLRTARGLTEENDSE